MIELLSSPEAWISLATLTALEIVLGIDNLLFLNIIAERVAPRYRSLARKLGLGLALAMRLVLLLSISWVMSLTEPLFTLLDFSVSARDLILGIGVMFLLAKGTTEIHHTLEGESEGARGGVHMSLGMAIFQIGVLDIVFSLDSVITAVGMARDIEIMITAVVIAMFVMLLAAEPVGRFVQQHPTVKMLALSFLLLIGVALVADALHFHIPKGYLYFAIAFSALVEALNVWRRNRLRLRREVAQ